MGAHRRLSIHKWILLSVALGGCGGGGLDAMCSDGIKNGDETAVDCGGSCPPCAAGKGCLRGKDCQSSICTNNTCAGPACNDGIKNSDETDIDCGGLTCPGCAGGQMCQRASDCASLVCTNNACVGGDTPDLSMPAGTDMADVPDMAVPWKTISFGAPSTFAVAGGSTWLAAGDLNGDNKADLAVTGLNVTALLGDGLGGFKLGAETVVGSPPNAIALSDFNLDGKLDFAVATGTDLEVALGAGAGKFNAPTAFMSNFTETSVIAGILGGKPSLVTTVPMSQAVVILLGNGNGTFQPGNGYALSMNPVAVAMADLNSDGKPDLAVIDTTQNMVYVLFGKGGDQFMLDAMYALGGAGNALAAGDLNQDGKPDLVASIAQVGVMALLNGGNGTFGAPVKVAGGVGATSVAIADFDGDQIPDVAYNDSLSGKIGVTQENGDGTIRSNTKFAAGAPVGAVVAADLNGDGIPDLAVANNHQVSVLLNLTK